MASKTDNFNVGLSADLKPRLVKHYGSEQKKSKVRSIGIPGLGRFAHTRDNGEADLFTTRMFSTSLGAILRAPDVSIRGRVRPGPILDEFDLGSGKVTNIGVTALANDSNWTAETAEPLNTFEVQKFINWGTGATAAEAYNWKLQTQAENESGKKEAVAASSSVLKWFGTGNAKIIITGTLEANLAGPTAITEWGLFSAAKTEGTTPKAATSTSGTSLTDTTKLPAPGTEASGAKKRGAQQYVMWAEKTESVYGLILKNTTEEVTIPGWVKNAEAATGTTPEATTKYVIYPVMWDHRVFAAINVEKGNKIEFPYELEIKSGG
jgi:hypothetical protein